MYVNSGERRKASGDKRMSGRNHNGRVKSLNSALHDKATPRDSDDSHSNQWVMAQQWVMACGVHVGAWGVWCVSVCGFLLTVREETGEFLRRRFLVRCGGGFYGTEETVTVSNGFLPCGKT